MFSELKKIVDASDNIVFFGGAGVSTESGIPDFRSVDGIYNQEYPFPPEIMVSHGYFKRHTEDFYDFYRKKLLHLEALPNKAHLALAKLEKMGKVKAVITQNIDGLHQKAGSKNVLELHGSVLRNFCEECKKEYDVTAVSETQGIPRCECGGIVRPNIVLYDESLNDAIVEKAIDYISKADVLIVGGTSLVVYPAAGMVEHFRGSDIILINKTPTAMDRKASFVFRENIGEVMSL